MDVVDARAEESERRWRAARSALDGTPDEVARQRLHRAKVTRLTSTVGAGVVAFVVVALILLLRQDHSGGPSPQGEVPLWREISGFSLMAVGLASMIVSFVRTVPAQRLGSAWRSASQILGWRERRHLLKQVRGRIAPDPAQLQFARHLAYAMIVQGHSVLLILGFVLSASGMSLINYRGGINPMAIVTVSGVVLLAIAVPLVRRDARSGRLFLDRYPWPLENLG